LSRINFSSQSLVSVIIPTYNSEKTLRNCLGSLKKQTYKNIEVIVVDRFSTDRTAELARRYGANVLLSESHRAPARNLGLLHAKGEYVLFLDSDMELSDDVVRQCVELNRTDPKIAGTVIPERSIGSSFWVKVRDFERGFYSGTRIESPRFFCKCLADQAGGYDQELIFYEESTLAQKIERLGYCTKRRTNAQIFHHEDDFSLIRWLARKYTYGQTLSTYKRRYRVYAQEQTSASHRLTLLLRARNPHPHGSVFLGVFALKWLELLATSFGVLVGNVRRQSPILPINFRSKEQTI
jgi:glycosyltransferase involved in cell wall biosynthesis